MKSTAFRTSMTVWAFVLDMMEVAASTGRRGNIVAVQDSFTCDIVHFAECCAYAKPFDFDIILLTSELTALLTALNFEASSSLCHCLLPLLAFGAIP